MGRRSARSPSVVIVLPAGTSPAEHDALGQAYRAFLDAVGRFGVEGRAAFVDAQEDPAALLESLARRRYDLIISPTLDSRSVEAAAERFPSSRFLMPDFSHVALTRPLRNVEGALFRSEQVGYLAGFLAALVARRAHARAISSVGGFKFPAVDTFIAGYRAGARKAFPGIRAMNDYAGDFLDPAKCRALALHQIARGSAVVFAVAGLCSTGALRAAAAERVWGVGVDVDQSGLGPWVLTSALKANGRPITDAIRQLARGRLKTGGDLVYDLRNGGVGLGRISPKVPKALVARVERIRAAIVAGTIVVPTAIT